jgi:hypothetical protein
METHEGTGAMVIVDFLVTYVSATKAVVSDSVGPGISTCQAKSCACLTKHATVTAVWILPPHGQFVACFWVWTNGDGLRLQAFFL